MTNPLTPLPLQDIDLSVQYLLNCGISIANVTEEHPHHLSCHGGNSLYAYEYIVKSLGFVPEDSCLGYIACSGESEEGWCANVRGLTTCEDWNICRTCDSFNEKTAGGDVLSFLSDNESSDEETRDAYGCKAIAHG